MPDSRDDELVTEGVELSKAELQWIRQQEQKRVKARDGRSKYVPHQGLKERTRRLNREA